MARFGLGFLHRSPVPPVFVIGGHDGTTPKIATSDDGSTWTSRTPAPSSGFCIRAMAFGAGVVVAIGSTTFEGTTPVVSSSVDGINWTQRTMAPSSGFVPRDICFGNGLFVAVGDDGTGNAIISTSPDGATWTQRTFAVAWVLYCVCWSGTKFVVAGDNNGSPPAAKVATSSNGTSWTDAAISISPASIRGVCWDAGNSKFVGVGNSGADTLGNPEYFTSTNGTTWSGTTNPGGTAASTVFYRVVRGGSITVAVGRNNNDFGAIISSSDDSTWTSRTDPEGAAKHRWKGLCYSANQSLFVAVSADAADGNQAWIITSGNGTSWTDRTNPISTSVRLYAAVATK